MWRSFYLLLFGMIGSIPLQGGGFTTNERFSDALAGGPSIPHMLIGTPIGSESPASEGLKKPGLAVLLSAAIPGTGEMYAGSWLKGAAFLGLEVGLWVGYVRYTDRGKDWEDQFHAFANTHWSEPRYWTYIAREAGLVGVTTENYQQFLDQLREYERQNHTHSLHVEKDQQYYEMIGKYNQFHYGWDDWQEGDHPNTPRRQWYETMRDNSNREFKKASTCAMVVLANHLLSACDAAWTVSRHNRRIQSALRITPHWAFGRPIPLYGVRLRW